MITQYLSLFLISVLWSGFSRGYDLTNCPASSVEYQPNEIDVQLFDGDPQASAILHVNASCQPEVDFYFLWDSSYSMRTYSSRHWGTKKKSLFNIINNMTKFNANMRFGLGFFTTKRLAGVGWKYDFVFRHAVSMTTNASLINQQFTYNATRLLTSAASDVTSALEALLQVIKRSDLSLGFRPGSFRKILVVTDAFFGQQYDATVRILQPLTENTGPSFGNAVVPAFPKNNLDATMESDCVLHGFLCPDTCQLLGTGVYNVLPSVYCHNCVLKNMSISRLNTSQFAEGSCEEFPNITAMVAEINTDPRHYEVIWVSAGTDDDVLAQHQAFVALLDPGHGRFLTSHDDLDILLPSFMNPENVSGLTYGSIPPLQNVTFLNCTGEVCSYQLNFFYNTSNAGAMNGDFPITTCDGKVYNISVRTCFNILYGSPSVYPSMSESASETISESHSPTLSPSDSLSFSESISGCVMNETTASESPNQGNNDNSEEEEGSEEEGSEEEGSEEEGSDEEGSEEEGSEEEGSEEEGSEEEEEEQTTTYTASDSASSSASSSTANSTDTVSLTPTLVLSYSDSPTPSAEAYYDFDVHDDEHNRLIFKIIVVITSLLAACILLILILALKRRKKQETKNPVISRYDRLI